MSDKPLTSCCQVTAYADPVYIVGLPGKLKYRIGSAARCSKCEKLKSDFRPDWSVGNAELSKYQKMLNGTAWAIMLDKQLNSQGAPLNFEIGSVGLKPENYLGHMRQQPELGAQ